MTYACSCGYNDAKIVSKFEYKEECKWRYREARRGGDEICGRSVYVNMQPANFRCNDV
ncbi:hypothetical protein [uncultured Campylobacter sp.]|uniref:hypothetical protein n=1 Tax=uncultured Campylobacter sp. TaxID=218934 RepID=UPI00261340DB|nr:hypothetical protein [uncultured Campylobacter sp.]